MREILSPQNNAEGRFVAKSPFKIESTIIYKLEAIRSFPELERGNYKVYERFYKPYGISESEYLADANLGASILFLRAKDGHMVYLPNTYLASYPGYASVQYTRNVLIMDLALVPSYVDVDLLKPQMKETVKKLLGIDTDVMVTTLEYEGVITEDDHKRMENLRKENLKGFETEAEQFEKSKKEVAALSEQNAELIKIIEAKDAEIAALKTAKK